MTSLPCGPALRALVLLVATSIGFAAPTAQGANLALGIDVLAEGGFAPLRGKRVGLLTHPAGVNREGVSTIQVLHRAPAVQLVALFGPEHGIYGDEKANVPVLDRIDPSTNLPVFSLYGQYRRPTAAMLDRIDVMVIDLQDLGVRSYTYVSCMKYVIEECFKAGKEVIVLDRPNPIGGTKVDGPPLEKRWMSYVGAFQVPYVHGLTIGELATMAKQKPGVLDVPEAVRRQGKLSVIPMRGWRRSMQWPETGLRWIPTSPAIPDLSAAMGYSMTGLGTQLGNFRHGYGTLYPFRLLQYTGRSPEDIAHVLKARRIPGVDFKILTFEQNGQQHRGVYVVVTDWNLARPTEVSFHMMAVASEWGDRNPFAAATAAQKDLYLKHVGDTAWWEEITSRGAQADVRAFVERWSRQALAFQKDSRAWWLYP